MPRWDTVICDIDGCLALHPLGRRIDFDNIVECERLMAANPPSLELAYLLDLMVISGKTIVLMTGRPERFRDCTLIWLKAHNIPFSRLVMRSELELDDPDWQVKHGMYKRLIKQGAHIFFVIEDRAAVVEMWRREGLLCLQPRNEN